MKLKKDRYNKTRGGQVQIMAISCTCGAYLLSYQKDGIGSLHRLYLDRMLEPEAFAQWQYLGISSVPNLVCPTCSNLLGTPIIYKPEGRLAIRLKRGTFSSKKVLSTVVIK